MNEAAMWAEHSTAALFSNSDSACGEKILRSLSQEGTRGEKAAATGTCYTLNMGGTCDMFQKVNLSLRCLNAGKAYRIFMRSRTV